MRAPVQFFVFLYSYDGTQEDYLAYILEGCNELFCKVFWDVARKTKHGHVVTPAKIFAAAINTFSHNISGN